MTWLEIKDFIASVYQLLVGGGAVLLWNAYNKWRLNKKEDIKSFKDFLKDIERLHDKVNLINLENTDLKIKIKELEAELEQLKQ